MKLTGPRVARTRQLILDALGGAQPSPFITSLFYSRLTSEEAARLLTTLGGVVSPHEIAAERRDERWLIRLPDARVAWIAASDQGRDALIKERRLLRLVRDRCRFDVPGILVETADGAADIRAMVPGVVDPSLIYQRVLNDQGAADRLGRNLGTALADLHAPSLAAEVAIWLPGRLEWPPPRPAAAESLRAVIDDPVLQDRADFVLARHFDVAASVTPDHRRLVHGDLGFHNIAVDRDTLALRGIFDWEAACWADPHLDFRYLVADLHDWTLFNGARAAYEEQGGTQIERERVILYNAAWAISYLAFRTGIAPDKRWCGRTLAEDLAWTRRAIDLVLN